MEYGRFLPVFFPKTAGPRWTLMVVDGIVTDYGNLLTMNPDEIVSIDVIRPSEFSQAYFCREPAPVVVVTTRSSLRKTFPD